MCEDTDRYKAIILRRKLKKLLTKPFTAAMDNKRLALLAEIRRLENGS